MAWHNKSLSEVEKNLSTNFATGLSQAEVEKRVLQYGKNEMTAKKKRSLVARIFDQFKDFMVIILLIAAAISVITTILSDHGEWIEPIVIIGIVLLNAFLGVYQESRAEAALDALKTLSAPLAKVIRDGKQETVKSSELVPGDVIVLEAGDFVPADSRLIESASLRSDESALTGESVPAEKEADSIADEKAGVGDRHNIIHSGCAVVYGRARAVVVSTGMNTEMGKIAALIDSTEDNETPLQVKLTKLGKTLGIIALFICAIIFVVGILFPSEDMLAMDLPEKLLSMFMTSVSLAVAAVPEGLPAIVTIVLAIGVQRMVKKNAIIRRLPAVETLGSASVICSDKTGTLTQNRMTLVKLYDGKETVDLVAEPNQNSNESVLKVLTYAALCCDADVVMDGEREVHIGDPTETGIVAAAKKYAGFDKAKASLDMARVSEIPFDSDRKLMTTINKIDGKLYAVVKGAPDILISRCTNFDSEAALKANADLGSQALRVLGVAIKELDSVPQKLVASEVEKDLTFIGLVGMIDPPRPEAFEAIKICKSAGIKVVMITGDHIATATAIAKQLGILESEEQAMSGAQLRELSDEQLFENIEKYTVYARVSPEDKIRIVKMWQKKDHVAAMTGDGVNDAPALKAADIGCAMGIAGTDVAKGAAAMTLTDDNFATIVTAVGEGRGIFDNIRKAVNFLLACNLGEIISVFIAILIGSAYAGWGTPLTPLMLLWINLVTDGLPALALGMEPVEKDVMNRKPRKKHESIFSGGLGIDVLWQGLVIGGITLVAYASGIKYGHQYAQTMAFAVLAISQLFHAMNVRSSKHSLFKIGFFTNKYMVAAFTGSLALMLIVLLTPARQIFKLATLLGSSWILVVCLAVLPFVIAEIVKLGKYLASRKAK